MKRARDPQNVAVPIYSIPSLSHTLSLSLIPSLSPIPSLSLIPSFSPIPSLSPVPSLSHTLPLSLIPFLSTYPSLSPLPLSRPLPLSHPPPLSHPLPLSLSLPLSHPLLLSLPLPLPVPSLSPPFLSPTPSLPPPPPPPSPPPSPLSHLLPLFYPPISFSPPMPLSSILQFWLWLSLHRVPWAWPYHCGYGRGLINMCLWERCRITIPAHLGYGERGDGAGHPPNSTYTLVFYVRLIKIERVSTYQMRIYISLASFSGPKTGGVEGLGTRLLKPTWVDTVGVTEWELVRNTVQCHPGRRKMKGQEPEWPNPLRDVARNSFCHGCVTQIWESKQRGVCLC